MPFLTPYFPRIRRFPSSVLQVGRVCAPGVVAGEDAVEPKDNGDEVG